MSFNKRFSFCCCSALKLALFLRFFLFSHSGELCGGSPPGGPDGLSEGSSSFLGFPFGTIAMDIKGGGGGGADRGDE